MWARVVASVRPLAPRAVSADAVEAPPKPPSVPAPRTRPAAPARSRPAAPGVTLDASWDRRLARGLVQPDAILDLHGHNLATAWDLLDRRLERAIREDARLLLLITGKPPKPERPPEPPTTRGAIRAAVGDWLAASRHAGRIAAVRNAHPRHGGLGALYIVLRRPRAGTPSF